jgi:hypothetical protein
LFLMRSTRTLAVLLAMLPATTAAQARFLPDPIPGERDAGLVAGGQVKQLPSTSPRRPVASQFDAQGTAPMGVPGDTVTIFYFGDGANLSRSRHARITSRQRFMPPNSWTRACDELAHPGWTFGLDAPATSNFAVVVPGRHDMPERRIAPPLARITGEPYFRAWADSVWTRYEGIVKPSTERARSSLWYSFYGETRDAGWNKLKMFGLRGPNGHNYAVFSVWMRDDQRNGAPNSTATWIIIGWGIPVAQANGNVDIYGTSDSDGDGIDEVITSNGLIRWDGQKWSVPEVYVEEPCMLRRVTAPPPGWRP